ncbi:CgeB family protein [Sediminibacillus terrae]|uniref:CgeB family protein n=1 Tax=Sediminibacillus terrae TaxID=1562106 RepID=UPI00129568F9|nr:glycosyltransferase [Sediminibacillus terrae]
MTINIKQRLKSIQEKRAWLNKRNSGSIFEELIHGSQWFKKTNDNIMYNENSNFIEVNIPENNQCYLTYLEKNNGFDHIPNYSIPFEKGQNENILKFEGKKLGALEVDFFVFSYNNSGKVETLKADLNTNRKITLSEEIEKIRIAIRFKGKGKLKLERLQLNNNILWEEKNEEKNSTYHYLSFCDWYVPENTYLSYSSENNTFKADFVDQGYTYLVHSEPNAKFENLQGNGIPINDTNSLSVFFNGQKTTNVDVKLVIILYCDGIKNNSSEIKLNEKSNISLDDEYDYFRLAIRVSGKGTFSVEEIIINNEFYWWGKELPPIKKHLEIKHQKSYRLNSETLIGWKRKDDKINYSQKYDIFETKLKGNQFRHLTCVDQSEVQFITPLDGKSYTIMPSGETYNKTNISLLIIGYTEGGQNILDEVPLNESLNIIFDKDVLSVGFMIRITGEGYFKNLEINIDEKPIEITNSMELDLSSVLWHSTNQKNIKLDTKKDNLTGNINIPVGKHLYISYKENNTSFGKMPTTKLMDIQKGYEYEFSVKSQVDDGVNLLPMFIGYSNNTKIQVLQLKPNSSMKIKPSPEVTQFRIALRVAGEGAFEISKFEIKEIESFKSERSLNFIDKFEVNKLNLLPDKPLKKLKMAVIFDEFTYESYKYECNLIQFTPENWLEVLTSEEPDLLMVESAWNGNDGTWNKRVGDYGEENSKPLAMLIDWCRQHNIPTVFWNKEDPVHFNRFIETAKKFDYIYTTDENMIESYQKSVGHSNVYALPFAAQPLIHNPMKIVDEREKKACFAGSYYRHHEERSVDMDRLLDSASKFGLDIYDRNYLMTKKGLMPNHQFPERFQPFIKGNLKYYEIDKAYKGYQVMINVNTVKDSPTMFSRRVFEGLACGTPVISTYAQGVSNIFGDLVEMEENPEDLDESFRKLLEEESFYNKKSIIGIREVLTKHTYTNRLYSIVKNAGLNFDFQYPEVSVIAFASTKEEYLQILQQFNRQAYKHKKLLVLVDTFDGYLEMYNKYNDDSIQTFIRSYMHNYNNILEWVDTPYIAYFSLEDYYGKNYLLDLMLSTLYTDSDFIGKFNYFTMDKGMLLESNSGLEYTFVSSLSASRTIIKTNVFSKASLEELLKSFIVKSDFSPYFKYGKQFYSSNKLNYVEGAYKEKLQPNYIKEIEDYIEI